MRRAVVLAFTCVALIACGPREMSRATPPTPRPKLVVLLVIDQLPTWAFERDKHLFTGGFARLLREGGYVRTAQIPYANSYTAPGHATIATGVPPSEHGIVGNTWYRRAIEKELSAEADATAPVHAVAASGGGEVGDVGASSASLRVPGVADALRLAHPGAHSVAIALKARAAVFMAGRHPDLVMWFDPKAGGMTTSRAYASTVPPWLVQLAKDKPPSRFVGQSWTPLDAARLASLRPFADDHVGEGDVVGLGRAFPHPITDIEALAMTPFADQIVLDAVDAAFTAVPLGRDDTPDLLAISLNAHDYAGHVYGPDSWEILDLTLRLDLSLGTLFDQLDRRFGTEGWAAILTSDHGATPLIERTLVPGSRRIPPGEIVTAIDQALTPLLGEGRWVANLSASQVHLSAAIPADKRDRARTLAAEAAARVPNVEGVYRVDEVQGGCEKRQALEQAVCFALAPGASGDLYIAAARGSLLYTGDHGTHHEAPNPDNREVPVFVRAPLLVRPSTIESASTLQIAPTIAALLGVPPPANAKARPLFGL